MCFPFTQTLAGDIKFSRINTGDCEENLEGERNLVATVVVFTMDLTSDYPHNKIHEILQTYFSTRAMCCHDLMT
jgi:hypothetical protein